MKRLTTLIATHAVAVICMALSLNAETYYLKANPEIWTTYTDANIWTNAAGTAITM
jgi:hypothetical protein